MGKKLNRLIKRILDYPMRAKNRSLLENPPAIRKNSIVMTSTDDFSDNPLALYQYMIDHGYNEKYNITWLFEFEKNYRELNTHNVKSVKMFNGRRTRTPESFEAILSAEYVFFSHNVNWAKNFRPEQTYINLWHGCGYKGRQPGEERVIQFDYCVTTGPKYARELTTHYLCEADKLKPLGYPRNDWFKTNNSRAGEYLEELKSHAGASKAVIWMPTFRKSKVSRITTETSISEYGLPLIESLDDLATLNEKLREKELLLIVKTHVLQSEADIDYSRYTNIVRTDNDILKNEDVILYELLARTDGLVTDYSSVAIDYILADKPIAYILTDFDEYESVRGWCYDNVKDYMPGHHVYTLEEFIRYFEDVAEGNDEYSQWRSQVCEDVHSDAECYAKNVLDYFGITLD